MTSHPMLADTGGAFLALFMFAFEAVLLIAILAGLWKIFVKAGHPGWAGIIPIYNTYILLQIVDKPIWWLILFFIPCVNVVIAILVLLELAKKFGQSTGFAIGLILLPIVFIPLLGFGDAKYQGSTQSTLS